MKEHVDSEVLAAITAALAVYGGKESRRLVIRSFRRIPQASPVWNVTGRMERLGLNSYPYNY